MNTQKSPVSFAFLFKLHGILHSAYEYELQNFDNETLGLFSSSLAVANLSDDIIMKSRRAIDPTWMIKKLKRLENAERAIDIAVMAMCPPEKYHVTQAWIKKNYKKEKVNKIYMQCHETEGEQTTAPESSFELLHRAFQDLLKTHNFVFVYSDVYHDVKKLLDLYPDMFNFIHLVDRSYTQTAQQVEIGRLPKTVGIYRKGYEDWNGHFAYATTLMDELLEDAKTAKEEA